jgi:hypothetical protein
MPYRGAYFKNCRTFSEPRLRSERAGTILVTTQALGPAARLTSLPLMPEVVLHAMRSRAQGKT